MAGEQSQFEGLLQNLLSTDNKIRVEAEVRELWVKCNVTALCIYAGFACFWFLGKCLYTCRVYCTLYSDFLLAVYRGIMLDLYTRLAVCVDKSEVVVTQMSTNC